jgi:hypothetical protein
VIVDKRRPGSGRAGGIARKAKVAVARKLAAIQHLMPIDETEFNWSAKPGISAT